MFALPWTGSRRRSAHESSCCSACAPAPTTRSRARDLLARVRKLGGARAAAAWGARVVARRVRAGFARTGLIRSGLASGPTDDGYTGGRELPPPDVFHAQLHGLLGRGVKIFA